MMNERVPMRDMFASMALASDPEFTTAKQSAKRAYDIADAMMVERDDIDLEVIALVRDAIYPYLGADIDADMVAGLVIKAYRSK